MTKTNSLKLVPYARVTIHYPGPSRTVRRLVEYTYGSPGEQTHTDYGRQPIEWRENVPFEATLTLDRLERGRSAARFWFIDEQGTEYPVFGQGLVDLLKQGSLDHGITWGRWIAVKRGSNYGIERYES